MQGEASSEAHRVQGTLLGKGREQQPLITFKHDAFITRFNCCIRPGCNTVQQKDGAEEDPVQVARKEWAFLKMKYLLKTKQIFLMV